MQKEEAILKILEVVYEKEKSHGITTPTLGYISEPEAAVKRFIYLKLLIRRLEFDMPPETWVEFYEYCQKVQASDDLIYWILQKNVFFQHKVCKNLAILFECVEGEKSDRTKWYQRLTKETEG